MMKRFHSFKRVGEPPRGAELMLARQRGPIAVLSSAFVIALGVAHLATPARAGIVVNSYSTMSQTNGITEWPIPFSNYSKDDKRAWSM
jgi:hypothetical protein